MLDKLAPDWNRKALVDSTRLFGVCGSRHFSEINHLFHIILLLSRCFQLSTILPVSPNRVQSIKMLHLPTPIFPSYVLATVELNSGEICMKLDMADEFHYPLTLATSG